MVREPTKEGSDTSEELRRSLYKRADVRALLDFAVNGHEMMQPTITIEGYDYPEISKLLKLAHSGPLLEELAEHRLYRRTVVDVEVACPDCGSLVTIHDSYACPFCKSPSLKRGTLLEHYKCGHVALMEEFAQADNLVCPKCRGVLRLIGTDYSKVQDTFRCGKCARSFSAPSIIHRCLKCKNKFSYENAKLFPVYTYEFNEAFRDEVVSNCVVEFPIVNYLRQIGFHVQAPGFIKGQSGIEQDFDIVANREGKDYVFAIAVDATEVTQDVVATLFAKKFDVEAARSFVVAIPKMNRDGLKVAQLYGIDVIQGANQAEVVNKIPALLQRIQPPERATSSVEHPPTDSPIALVDLAKRITQQTNVPEQTRSKQTATPFTDFEEGAIEFRGKPSSILNAGEKTVSPSVSSANRPSPDARKCDYCGRQLGASVQFCDQCGRVLARSVD